MGFDRFVVGLQNERKSTKKVNSFIFGKLYFGKATLLKKLSHYVVLCWWAFCGVYGMSLTRWSWEYSLSWEGDNMPTFCPPVWRILYYVTFNCEAPIKLITQDIWESYKVSDHPRILMIIDLQFKTNTDSVRVCNKWKGERSTISPHLSCL